MRKFESQVVLITGASSGVGRALAHEFAGEGAHTVLAARNVPAIESLARELTTGQTRSVAVACDVTRDGDLEAAVACATREFGRLDVAVANAGFSVKGNFLELTLDDYRRQFETNLFGVMRTLYAALPELRKTRGRAVIIGSLLSALSVPGGTAYSMSKYALASLAEGLSYELAPSGVTVTQIMAGFMDTGIYSVGNDGVRSENPGRRPPKWIMMPASRAARQIVSAVFHRKRTQVITGHAKALIFLQRHFPRLLHFSISQAIRRAAGPARG